jgi:hypothetical protein
MLFPLKSDRNRYAFLNAVGASTYLFEGLATQVEASSSAVRTRTFPRRTEPSGRDKTGTSLNRKFVQFKVPIAIANSS